MYDAMESDGTLDSLFVNGDGVGLCADDEKLYCAA